MKFIWSLLCVALFAIIPVLGAKDCVIVHCIDETGPHQWLKNILKTFNMDSDILELWLCTYEEMLHENSNLYNQALSAYLELMDMWKYTDKQSYDKYHPSLTDCVRKEFSKHTLSTPRPAREAYPPKNAVEVELHRKQVDKLALKELPKI